MLVVEDDPTVRQVLCLMLAAVGYDAVPLASGGQTVHVARTLRPRLITLDLALMDVDGLAVLAELRRTPDLADIPVLIISAHVASLPARQLDGASVLAKPFTMESLQHAVNRALADVPDV